MENSEIKTYSCGGGKKFLLLLASPKSKQKATVSMKAVRKKFTPLCSKQTWGNEFPNDKRLCRTRTWLNFYFPLFAHRDDSTHLKWRKTYDGDSHRGVLVGSGDWKWMFILRILNPTKTQYTICIVLIMRAHTFKFAIDEFKLK